MKLFKRKSNWDRVRDAMTTTMEEAMANGGLRRVTRMAASAIGGAIAVAAASAAISSVRHQDDS